MTRKLPAIKPLSRAYEIARLIQATKRVEAIASRLLAERSKQATARVLAERLVDKLLNEG